MGEIQKKLKATLESVGLPFRELQVYGSQIVVTTISRDTAAKWGTLLAKFAKVRRVALESVDYAKENKGSNLLPTTIKVFRTYAVIQ